MRSSKASLQRTRRLLLHRHHHQRQLSSTVPRQQFPNPAPRFGAFAQSDSIPLPTKNPQTKASANTEDSRSRSGTFAGPHDDVSLPTNSFRSPTDGLSRRTVTDREGPFADRPFIRKRFEDRPERESSSWNGSNTWQKRTPLESRSAIQSDTWGARNDAARGIEADRGRSDSSLSLRDTLASERRGARERAMRSYRDGSTQGFDRNSGSREWSFSNRDPRPRGRYEQSSSWGNNSRFGRNGPADRRENTGSWGEFQLPTDSGFQEPVVRPTNGYNANASDTQSSKTAGIMSRHKRRQGRFDSEEQTTKKETKGKGSRRSRDEEDDDDRVYKMEKADYMAAKEARKKQKAEEALKAREKAEQKRIQIKLPPYISIANLAKALNVRFEDFVVDVKGLGFQDMSHDHVLSPEDAGIIVMWYGFELAVQESSEDIVAAPWPKDDAELEARPPVVTIMGHVDHGKTTLLDYLRKSSIAAGEFGGITQHIGAFSVPLSSGKTITFLDTPGHSAFLSMRQRGATVTDIVVLVVAADDGVMPQTLEAIKHAKAAEVPIIVAVNKIDKGEANIDHVKQELSRHDVDIEDHGGEVQVIPVSGKTGQGMDDLEESIITLSEILDHKAPRDGKVEGSVLEATTKPHGRVATILIRRGVMQPGDILVAGPHWGRVKTLRNEFGTAVDSAGPGIAVEIDGWRDELPSPGDEVLQADDEQHAATVVRTRLDRDASIKAAQDMEAINVLRRETRQSANEANEQNPQPNGRRRNRGVALDQDALRERKIDGTFVETPRRTDGVHEAFFVVKADVEGSVEAVVDLVAGLGNARARANIVRAAAGAVNESDVELAHAARGHILAFNTDIDGDIRTRADRAGVPIVEQRVIYRVAESVNAILAALLPDVVTQRVTGEAEVLQSFSIRVDAKVAASRAIVVAGCRVRNGLVARGSKVRVLRAGEVVYDGILESLKNVKKDVAEMKKDTECGMRFGNGWTEFRAGDQVQCYTETRERDTL